MPTREAKLFDPKVALLRKILSGDKSDNIPSIKPRLEPKTAIAL
jgi:5'-3' exonuclease